MKCSCLHHARIVVCTLFLVCHAIISWEPGNRDQSPSLLLVPHTCSFPSASQSSYRNRNVAVAPFSLSLPWHPFSFHHGDKCFIICSSQLFHKKCLKLAYAIRIMITTFKMVKIVVCIKLLNAHEDLPKNCCLIFPASFKMPNCCILLMFHLLPRLTTFKIVGYINGRELNNCCGVSSICNSLHIELHLTCSFACALCHAMPH